VRLGRSPRIRIGVLAVLDGHVDAFSVGAH
jgi:hypothetical protein